MSENFVNGLDVGKEESTDPYVLSVLEGMKRMKR